MERDDRPFVRTVGIEPKIWTKTSTTMSLEEKKSKFREMELKHEVSWVVETIIVGENRLGEIKSRPH